MISYQNMLSAVIHELALRGLSGEFGRSMVNADMALPDFPEEMSPAERYARVVEFIAKNSPLRILPEEMLVGAATYREATFHRTPILGNSSTSHVTIGFDLLLKEGYKGIRNRIEKRLQEPNLDAQYRDYLDAMIRCINAANIWHSRYMDALHELEMTADTGLKKHWHELSETLVGVPDNPPENFRQAVQALWFSFDFQRLCGNWSGIGRIDQMLGPYLSRDLADKIITLDEARELLAHFWIKGTEWIGVNNERGSGDAQHYQNIILGGIDSDGNEVTNEVTYLILDIAEELLISDFPIAVRVNPKSPPALLKRIAEIWRAGAGFVSIYNESRVIEALCKFGYPEKDARNFTNDGCWEPIIPGKTAFTYSPFDTLLCLQDALKEDDYTTFIDLYAAFIQKIDNHIEKDNQAACNWCRGENTAPLLSLLVEGCIEKGRDYYNRGPIYTVLAVHAGGIQDAANSLTVIKRLVYEERRLTLSQLKEILANNWVGQEHLRRNILNNFEFYGNDDEAADAMVYRIFDDYTALVAESHEVDRVLRPAGISTFGREIEWRETREATASGHVKGDILACNFSPTPGSDKRGPLAAIKSYCKMDFSKLPNCGTLELKIIPATVKGEAGIEALTAMIRAFMRLGGMYLNVDVLDTETLQDAQKHPERYPNLAVRVAGWNARFATLDQNWQEMVIQRTEQELV